MPPDNDVVDEAWCGRCGTCCGACCGDCYRVCCGGLAAWIKEKWFGLGWCREKRRREVVRVARAGKRVDRGRSGGNGRNGDGLLIGDGGSDEGRSEQRREREVNVEGESGENWIGNSYDKSESGEEREQGEGENGNDRGEDGNDVEGEQGDGENGDGNSEGESNVVQREARERDENGEAEDESGMVHQESEYDVRAREEGNKTSWRTWGGSIRGLSR